MKMATSTTIKVFVTFFVLFCALPMNLSSRVPWNKELKDTGVERFLRETPSGSDPHYHDSQSIPPRSGEPIPPRSHEPIPPRSGEPIPPRSGEPIPPLSREPIPPRSGEPIPPRPSLLM